MKAVAHIVIPHDSLVHFLFPIPTTLGSPALEVLVPQGAMLSPVGSTMIPLNWKLKLLPGHSGLLKPLNQQAKKGFTVLFLVIDVDCQGEIELLSRNEYVWNAGDPLGQILLHPYFVNIKSVENYNNLQFRQDC